MKKPTVKKNRSPELREKLATTLEWQYVDHEDYVNVAVDEELRSVLITGDPGSGKSTILVQLSTDRRFLCVAAQNKALDELKKKGIADANLSTMDFLLTNNNNHAGKGAALLAKLDVVFVEEYAQLGKTHLWVLILAKLKNPLVVIRNSAGHTQDETATMSTTKRNLTASLS